MTPREFRQEQEFEFDHFQELTNTGIKPNYVNIELFAHEYHKRKLKLLGIGDVVSSKRDETLELLEEIMTKVKDANSEVENGIYDPMLECAKHILNNYKIERR
tara:strand:- start:364 stop:672 length:309 start_codon:yes stop_codon:yes gene_type:complete